MTKQEKKDRAAFAKALRVKLKSMCLDTREIARRAWPDASPSNRRTKMHLVLNGYTPIGQSLTKVLTDLNVITNESND